MHEGTLLALPQPIPRAGRGVVDSMNGARFVHDELINYGWEVLVADAQRVKGLAPLACKTDKSAWTAAHRGAMKCLV